MKALSLYSGVGGNAVVPAQVLPIFAAIKAIHDGMTSLRVAIGNREDVTK